MPKLANVNATDVKGAIALGCRTMESVFSADDSDVPFFASRVVPRVASPLTGLSFSTLHSEAHVPGRHLNALLNAEAAAGVELDESAIEKHARAAFFSFSGSVALPLNREAPDGPVVRFSAHNCREGMHALYALAAYRDSAQARETAERMIAAMFEYWNPQDRWDVQRLEAQHSVKFHPGPFIAREARMIGPLVKYYRATGYGPALDLAVLLKDKAVGEFFRENGEYDGDLFGHHTHSATCTMSSLAQLADLTNDATLMKRVRAFYDNGLWQIRDGIGWVIEGSQPDAPPERGEVNNTGDIVETGLILGRWGHADAYQDAERILRCHLLPSQLRDNSFIVEPPNPEDEDGKRNIADRHLGAFGLPAPYGHWPVGFDRIAFNMDIVGGAVGSLCEALRHAVRTDEAGHHVNLLFDHETDAVKVESPYTCGELRVTVKRPAPLWVRMPRWADRHAITLTGTDVAARFTGDHLFMASPEVGRPITISFDLPVEELVLKHRTHDIRVRLRGDEVVAMDDFGMDLTFFDPHG